MDKNLITSVLARLQDPGPLDPNPSNEVEAAHFHELYINNLHVQQGRAVDIAKKLAERIDLSTGARHAYLFSGTIGSGKSTELRRVANELKKDLNNFAFTIDALHYLNPNEPIDIVDLLLALACGVWESTANELGFDATSGDRYHFWRSVFSASPELKEVEVNAGVMKVKAVLKGNASIRTKMHQHYQASLEKFVSDFNQFMDDCAQQIRKGKSLAASAKIVLIVDSLEHFGGKPMIGQVDEVFLSLQKIFNNSAHLLRLDGWSVVYSVPPLLQKIAPGLAASFDASSNYALTSAHVFKDRSTTWDDDTITNKLLPLVRKRIGEDDIDALIPSEVLKDIIVHSGGDLRDLMRMLRGVITEGYSESALPVDQPLVDRVYDNLRRPYLPLPQDTLARLQTVTDTHDVQLASAEDWQHVISDLAQKRMLLYVNGTEWYGVHPLLHDYLDSKKTAAA